MIEVFLLCDSKTDKIVGRVDIPVLIDAKGNEDYESVKYILDKDEKTKITIEVDQEYFDQEDLTYPVTIDPTAFWMHTKLNTAQICSMSAVANQTLHPTTLHVENKCRTNFPYVGTEQRIYIDTSYINNEDSFAGSSGAFKDKYIEEAKLSLYEVESGYTPATLEVHKPENTWNYNSVTWNNQPYVGSKVYGSATMSGETGEVTDINITEWAQNLADGSITDTGLVLVAREMKALRRGFIQLALHSKDI